MSYYYNIYGELNKQIEYVKYKGGISSTATVDIQDDNSIVVDVNVDNFLNSHSLLPISNSAVSKSINSIENKLLNLNDLIGVQIKDKLNVLEQGLNSETSKNILQDNELNSLNKDTNTLKNNISSLRSDINRINTNYLDKNSLSHQTIISPITFNKGMHSNGDSIISGDLTIQSSMYSPSAKQRGTITGGNINVDGSANIGGDLNVSGNLKILGESIVEDVQSLRVKDNYIVTRYDATSAPIRPTGLIMNINGNDSVGIIYDPITKSVNLGLGRSTDNEGRYYEFIESESHPLVIRPGEQYINDGDIVTWKKEEITHNGQTYQSIMAIDSGQSLKSLKNELADLKKKGNSLDEKDALLDTNIKNLDAKLSDNISKLEKNTNDKVQAIDTSINDVEHNIDDLSESVNIINNKTSQIESKINDTSTSLTNIEQNLNTTDTKVKSIIDNIGDKGGNINASSIVKSINEDENAIIDAESIDFEGKLDFTDFNDESQRTIEASKIDVQIWSSRGNIFKSKDVKTILSCHVFRAGEEITDKLHISKFTWIKLKDDGSEDPNWPLSPYEKHAKSIAITDKDIYSRSVFTCKVEIN